MTNDSRWNDNGSGASTTCVLGRLHATKRGWELEVAGTRQAVSVLWELPESLEGRLLRWERSKKDGLVVARVWPTTVQPEAVVTEQPNGRLPDGLRAGVTRREGSEAANAADTAAALRARGRQARAEERRKAADRSKRVDAVMVHNRLGLVETSSAKKAAKPTQTTRVCKDCKQRKSVKIDFAHPRTAICIACTTKTNKRGSVWTVASAGSPGLGKRR